MHKALGCIAALGRCAYCYSWSSMVCWSVYQSVCVYNDIELCKNGWTDRLGVWFVDSGGPKEPCIRWEFRSPHM